ncbi:hypothetical protein [Butyricicoccus porcorum]|uniref:PAS domain-containing protein n=1 Tax=Butyricicoccus porcorum TaxID=1945634 RepID=A0A252F4E6_9FIRM|nr:hypothetical protein [Butyricicoccus porcorum]OUM20612.1 hypothetical protein CBW42_07220 [Butyricicoccus porcorum]
MRKTLKRKLTGSMLLTVAAALVIVSVCLLLGVVRYSAAQFSHEIAEVFTTDVLTEMNAAATGSAESAAAAVGQAIDANAGVLRIGAGREYSVWDAETGDWIGGSQENAAVTDNIVAAMNGEVGQSIPLLASRMDIAIPINGDVMLVVDIMDDGSSMRTLLWNILLLLLAACVLSLVACLVLSHTLAGAFAASAVETARGIREHANDSSRPAGDWEAMALALYQSGSSKRRRKAETVDMLDAVMPYLREGYLRFTAEDGIITEINTVAEHLLGVTMDTKNGLAFADAFPGVPMPDETQSMVHGQFTRAGRRLDVVFTALGDGTFAAVLRPVDRERAL